MGNEQPKLEFHTNLVREKTTLKRSSKYFDLNIAYNSIVKQMFVAPGNVASPGNVIIYGKCRSVAGKCRNLLKTS